MKSLFGLFIITLFIAGCGKSKIEKRAEKDDATIQAYIASHNLDAIKTESGLYVVINNPGAGASCNSASTVSVAYKGYYDNGTVFDESETGIEISLNSVIEGWKEGIPYFDEGGKGILLIPSALGYGTSGKGGIAGNTVLIFDVELLQVF